MLHHSTAKVSIYTIHDNLRADLKLLSMIGRKSNEKSTDDELIKTHWTGIHSTTIKLELCLNKLNHHQMNIKKKIKNLGGSVLWKLEGFISAQSKVATTPILDKRIFKWTKNLEQNWTVIRAELDDLISEQVPVPRFQDVSKDQASISKTDDWRTFFLYGFGYKVKHNCELCPETAAILSRIPNLKTAFFSILKPGLHIPPHRGIFKGLIRYHLGLKVPEDHRNCKMRIDKHLHVWEEGKGILFDDTFEHEVSNDTDESRVVLLLDVERPLKFPARLLNKFLLSLVKFSPYVQDARRNVQNM